MMTLIANDVPVHAQEAVLAFTDPEGMEIANRLCHGKGREAPLSMDLLHEAKTGLACGLQLLKCLRFPLCCLLSCRILSIIPSC